MKRYGAVLGLKPEAVADYVRVHAAVWPDVLKQIKASIALSGKKYSNAIPVYHLQLLLVHAFLKEQPLWLYPDCILQAFVAIVDSNTLEGAEYVFIAGYYRCGSCKFLPDKISDVTKTGRYAFRVKNHATKVLICRRISLSTAR